MEIQDFKDGDLLLMKLASDIWLEHLEKAVLYREKMRDDCFKWLRLIEWRLEK